MDLEQLVENSEEEILSWKEPWLGEDEQGNRADSHIVVSASVKDCIQLSRRVATSFHKKLSDEELLTDFIITHWAIVSTEQTIKGVRL